MTSANMKLVVLDVPLEGDMESPEQNLEDGESIVRRIVEVKNLCKVLRGTRGRHTQLPVLTVKKYFPHVATKEYEKKVWNNVSPSSTYYFRH